LTLAQLSTISSTAIAACLGIKGIELTIILRSDICSKVQGFKVQS
jgi:hypothetical protein